jgi:hypothetical protein
VTIAAGAQGVATVTCPTGMVAIGGGDVNNPGGAHAQVQIEDMYPQTFPAGLGTNQIWVVENTNETGSTQSVEAWANCVPASFVTIGAGAAAVKTAAAAPSSGRTP